MALYIRDERVDKLAEDLMRATGAKSKTETVRLALEAQLKAAQSKVPLIESIQQLRAESEAIGPVDPAFDEKAFADAQWEKA